MSHPQAESFASSLLSGVRFFVGVGLMLVGGVLVITFWLLPVGVVLALFGLAVLCSDDGTRAPGSQRPASAMRASAAAYRRILHYLTRYQSKTGTSANPDRALRNDRIAGLALNLDRFGRPLCPCVHKADEDADAGEDSERLLCPCDEMRKYKYCHCLMFVTPDGLPITEHLPLDHSGRRTYGVVKDPAPELSG